MPVANHKCCSTRHGAVDCILGKVSARVVVGDSVLVAVDSWAIIGWLLVAVDRGRVVGSVAMLAGAEVEHGCHGEQRGLGTRQERSPRSCIM